MPVKIDILGRTGRLVYRAGFKNKDKEVNHAR